MKSTVTGDLTGAPAKAATKPSENVLNLAEALARVEGNTDLLAKIARMFLELYPKLLEESHEAVLRADCELLARAARTHRVVGGAIGRRQGAQRCQEARRIGPARRSCPSPECSGRTRYRNPAWCNRRFLIARVRIMRGCALKPDVSAAQKTHMTCAVSTVEFLVRFNPKLETLNI